MLDERVVLSRHDSRRESEGVGLIRTGRITEVKEEKKTFLREGF